MNKLALVIRNYLLDYRLSKRTHEELADELAEIIFEYIQVDIIGRAKLNIPTYRMKREDDSTP